MIESIHVVSLVLYHTFLFPVVLFSFIYYLITFGSILENNRNKNKKNSKNSKCAKNEEKELPFITIQIPVYNDPIAVRCIEHCLKLDYPKNKYEIIVADDSTDEETIKLLKSYEKYENVRIVHRNNRKGYKAGALNNILKYSRGEIIVIFDSDYIPKKDFLREIVPLFEDEKVAIVQTKIDIINTNDNILTKFASCCLMIYHNCFMPLNQKAGVVFFCGTAGAIRKRVLEEVGGWNENSITEDSDLSLRTLLKGYKHIYTKDTKASGEVPNALKAFINQQMRWCYGMTRVFIDNWNKILFSKNLTFQQKIIIILLTLGYLASPFVIGMTLFGLLSWITGEPTELTILDITRIILTFLATSGFIFSSYYALKTENKTRILREVIFATYTIGLLLSIMNTISLMKAFLRREMYWHRTPKVTFGKCLKETLL